MKINQVNHILLRGFTEFRLEPVGISNNLLAVMWDFKWCCCYVSTICCIKYEIATEINTKHSAVDCKVENN